MQDPLFQKLNKGTYVHLLKIPSIMPDKDYRDKVNGMKGSVLPLDLNYEKLEKIVYHIQMII